MTNQNPLSEKDVPHMNEAQKAVVLAQWLKHQHDDFEVDFDVSGRGDILKGFLIKKGVWNPFLASAGYHARYLFYHNVDFYGKECIEIGSGTGIMAVIMAMCGAKKVIASDISPLAVENTKENVRRFKLGDKIEVIQGDLFENIKEKADYIAWMIPFFSGNPPKGDTISASMIMPPELFERFLIESKEHLNPGGRLVICSYSLGGDFTDPVKVGEKLGYDVRTTWIHNSINGIQRGMLYMHELSLR